MQTRVIAIFGRGWKEEGERVKKRRERRRGLGGEEERLRSISFEFSNRLRILT